ncbi:MAG: hypothetical protein ACYDH2_06845, partial [Anaerolineaceae bacterium]
MNETPIDKDRRIIPRWRNSQISKRSRETNSLLEKKNNEDGISYIVEKKGIWDNNKSLENAIDLVTCAFSQGFEKHAYEAADFILANKKDVFSEVVKIAELIRPKSSIAKNLLVPAINELVINMQDIFSQIHTLRLHLTNYPHNAFLWVDLAQAYIRINQIDQAQKSIAVAINLSPNNRFILRSATRMFIHLHEPDKANHLLLSRPITRFDPWLISAEIATSTIERKTSSLLKIGRDMILNQRFSPIHLSELSSAIGTVDYINGSMKIAKKMFQFSLIDPTENSVAQSMWAKRKNISIDNTIAINQTPKIYEAIVCKSFFECQWDTLIYYAKKWNADEPFSSRPAEMGSFAAADGKEDYQLAELFCRSGLIANPTDPTLINNLAFSLINQNRIEDAETILNSIKNNVVTRSTEVAIKATEGLLNFRKGNLEIGKNKYLEAMSIAESKYSLDYKNRVSIYFAEEMYRN